MMAKITKDQEIRPGVREYEVLFANSYYSVFVYSDGSPTLVRRQKDYGYAEVPAKRRSKVLAVVIQGTPLPGAAACA